MPPDAPRPLREIYVEFVKLGNAVKATAIDPTSGREASVIGPLNAPQAELQKLAIRKLGRLLGDAVEPREIGGPSPGRPGIVV